MGEAEGIAQNEAQSLVANEEVEHPQHGTAPNVEVQVYKKRWYILLIFSFLGIFQGMVWNTFGPISASVLALFCPDWTNATLALYGNWGNIMYIIPVIPVMWFFTTQGLRPSMVLTGALMMLGTLLRALPLKVGAFTIMCHLCAIFNGIAGIIIFSAPSAVSSAWFPPEERTTATGIAIVFNNLGNAVSFLLGPVIVPGPNGTHLVHTEPQIMGFGELVANSSNDCRPIPEEERMGIQSGVTTLMYLEFGMVTACFLAILIYFPSKPKNPPSLSSAMERMDFGPGLKKLVTNRDALLMTLSFSLFNGLIASWYSVMNITFEPLPLGNTEDKDKIIGHIGLWAIIGNSVAAILVSRIVDSIRGRMKLTLLILMSMGILCWIWLGLICLGVIPFSLIQLYISTILASSLTYSTGPIFFEFTVELVYPVPEGIVGGFLTTVYNSIGMVFLFLFYVPQVADHPEWIPYAIMASTVASFPLMLLVQERYNRSSLD
eukprot:maker-scaffold427_size174323-snap-gene-0.36 protein:Tk04501 transcript:maker-scaffold427_size174323-snap-gene-0.36-mRNA-1 annotation:"hypothetical protein DAPPUDRAFT_102163"